MSYEKLPFGMKYYSDKWLKTSVGVGAKKKSGELKDE